MKKIIMAAIAMSFSAGLANASSSFVSVVNSALGNGASVSCGACHNGATATSTATLPMAVTWKNGGRNTNSLLASTDSDNDGFTNQQEVNASKTYFNASSITPFTLLTITAADKALTNVKVEGDTLATEVAFTDTAPIAGAGKEILGAIKINITPPVTLTFKAGGADSAAVVHTVDAAGSSTGTVTSTVNNNGSVVITALTRGATNADVVVVRTPASSNSSSTATQGDASVYGCVSASITTPATLLMVMLSLGFFLRRKKV